MEHIEKAREEIRNLEKRVEQLERESKEKDELLAKLQAGETTDVPEDLSSLSLPERLIKILEKVNTEVSSEELLAKAKAATAATGTALANETSDNKIRYKIHIADNIVKEATSKIWRPYGFDSETGVEQAKACVDDPSVPQEVRARLEEAITAFTEIEERVVIISAMGEEEYHRQQQDMADMQAAMREVQMALMFSTDTAARGAFVAKVNREAQAVFAQKLNGAKSRAEMDQKFGQLTAQERLAVFRAQALSQILGMGGGSHSHNGQPCHGHGHQQQAAHTHTHSHGGQPCGGHGHSHGGEEEEDDEDLEEGEYYDEEEEDCCDDEDEGHGHSHDHHGHSHDDHGHSHDHHGHSHDHHGHSHDHHGHSH